MLLVGNAGEETSEICGFVAQSEWTATTNDSLEKWSLCQGLSASSGLTPCLDWNSLSKSKGLKEPACNPALISEEAGLFSPTSDS